MILGLAAQAILLMHLRRWLRNRGGRLESGDLEAPRAGELTALGWTAKRSPQVLFGAPLALVILAARLGIWDLKARRADEMTAWGGAKRSPRYAKRGLALKARRHVPRRTSLPCDLFYLS